MLSLAVREGEREKLLGSKLNIKNNARYNSKDFIRIE